MTRSSEKDFGSSRRTLEGESSEGSIDLHTKVEKSRNLVGNLKMWCLIGEFISGKGQAEMRQPEV